MVSEWNTFGADGGHVSPVILLKDVDHGLSLKLVGGNDADEIAESILIRQVPTGGAVSDLRNVEQLQQVLHLDADGTGTWTDDTN